MKIRYFSTKAAADRFCATMPGGTAYTCEPSVSGDWVVEWEHQIVRGRLV